MLTNNLIDTASFQPIWMEPQSAWVGHLPFADWLIRETCPRIFVELGTHSGNSYFSFCQSVLNNSINTKCFAVDTWVGDEHAGRYGEEIYAKVSAHEAQFYSKFSRLLRSTFDEAISSFEDKSIDILHIDGLHTYDAVHHDFNSWLPKLAPGAIVLFHDTNVFEGDFGVHKFWKELQEIYPNNLEFLHSHGLGVLQLNEALENNKLPWLQPDFPDKERLVAYFAALGACQLARIEINKLKLHLASPNLGIKDRDDHILHLQQVNGDRIAQISHLESVVLKASETIKARDVQISHLEGALLEATEIIKARDTQISHLEINISDLDHRMSLIINSRSWRMTRPLRDLKRLFK